VSQALRLDALIAMDLCLTNI
jgi:Amino acid permease